MRSSSSTGGKAIILGRFVPIVRTFVPFVAGAAQMTTGAFVLYNAVGAVAWVSLCLGAGWFFGNIPIIKNNFSLVTIGIVVRVGAADGVRGHRAQTQKVRLKPDTTEVTQDC